MSRFVILFHQLPTNVAADSIQRQSHWDLMIERDGSLLTWALESYPRINEAIAATQLPDHRLHYLDYEGPVSNGRGNVQRIDRGTSEIRHYDAECLTALLQSNMFDCLVRIERLIELGEREQLENLESTNQRRLVSFSPTFSPPKLRKANP